MNDVADSPGPLATLSPTLERLRTAWRANKPSLAQRRADLGRLRHVLARRLDAMDAAIRADFGHRSPHENLISEAMITLSEIDLARRKLRRWAKPRRVGVGWKFWPGRAAVKPLRPRESARPPVTCGPGALDSRGLRRGERMHGCFAFRMG